MYRWNISIILKFYFHLLHFEMNKNVWTSSCEAFSVRGILVEPSFPSSKRSSCEVWFSNILRLDFFSSCRITFNFQSLIEKLWLLLPRFAAISLKPFFHLSGPQSLVSPGGSTKLHLCYSVKLRSLFLLTNLFSNLNSISQQGLFTPFVSVVSLFKPPTLNFCYISVGVAQLLFIHVTLFFNFIFLERFPYGTKTNRKKNTYKNIKQA